MALSRSFFSETAVALGFYSASGLFDIQKFYDSLPWIGLARAALRIHGHSKEPITGQLVLAAQLLRQFLTAETGMRVVAHVVTIVCHWPTADYAERGGLVAFIFAGSWGPVSAARAAC